MLFTKFNIGKVLLFLTFLLFYKAFLAQDYYTISGKMVNSETIAALPFAAVL